MRKTASKTERHPRYQIIIDEEVKTQAAQAVAQGRILDLKNDIVFKSFFSKDCRESAYCRRKMLSAVIGRIVTETTVLNPEILPGRTDGKFPRLDIHCTLEDGSEVDVELQNSMYDDDQIKRSIYYAATLTHNALSSGQPYSKIPHVYQIMFMNFKMLKDKTLHHVFVFKDRENNSELSDCIQIHYIELPKLSDDTRKQDQELSDLEFWVMLILAEDRDEMKRLFSSLKDRQEEMKMAQTLLDTMSVDQQEWENQIGYERFIHDCVSREDSAFSRGEHYARIETARLMLANKMPVSDIAKYTSLTEDEISAL